MTGSASKRWKEASAYQLARLREIALKERLLTIDYFHYYYYFQQSLKVLFLVKELDKIIFSL